MTPEARDAFFRVKDLLVNAAELVIMNETDPLIFYTDASTVSILFYWWSLDEREKWNRETHHFHIPHLVGSSDALGNYGTGALRIREATQSLLDGQTF